MNKTFIITHGAGTVLTAIPALEKFSKNNPDNDFKLITGSWSQLLWGNPIFQNRFYEMNGQKGLFDIAAKNNKIISLEPYYVSGYYNQQLHLIEAFDEIINETTVHDDLPPMRLYPSKREMNSVSELLNSLRENQNKKKIIVMQPYGSGAEKIDGRVVDSSARSFDADDYLYLLKKLAKKYVVVYFGPNELRHPGDIYTPDLSNMNLDIRFFISLIKQCDYFLGCDSLGQHMARALDKPGTVILGGTSEVNVSYKNHFEIIRNDAPFSYVPIRISSMDCEFANKVNEAAMSFTISQLEEIAQRIIERI